MGQVRVTSWILLPPSVMLGVRMGKGAGSGLQPQVIMRLDLLGRPGTSLGRRRALEPV